MKNITKKITGLLFLILISTGAFAQLSGNWKNVGNGLQQKLTLSGDTLSRFIKTPGNGGEFNISEQLNKKQNRVIINIDDFGAVGDGVTEDSIAIYSAIAAARSAGAELWGSANKTYKFSPKQETELSGIPYIRNLRLDLTSVIGDRNRVIPNSIESVFKITGTKTLLTTGVTTLAGNKTATIATGLNIQPGDVLFLTSLNQHYNTTNNESFLGQRITVDSYNSSTGVLVPYNTFNFDITSGYLWKNDYMPFIGIDATCEFFTSDNNELVLLYSTYANIDVKGTYKNFGYSTIALSSSEGYIYGAKIFNPSKIGNGLSYGISVWDLSIAFINAHIEGGRHAVTGGGGRQWNQNEMGGSNANAVFPGEFYIDGGYYAGTNGQNIGTIDTHSTMYMGSIKNATINGGISLSGIKNIISNSEVYISNIYGLVMNDGRLANSELIVDRLIIFCDKLTSFSPLYVGPKMKRVWLRNISIAGTVNQTLKPIQILEEISDLQLSGIDINLAYSGSFTGASDIRLFGNTTIDKHTTKGVTTIITPQVSGLEININNSSFSGSTTQGVTISGATNRPKTVRLINNVFRDNAGNGILINSTQRVYATGNQFKDNGSNTGLSGTARAGIYALSVDTLSFIDNDTRNEKTTRTQTYGLFHSSGSVNVLNGNDFRGNLTAPGYSVTGTTISRLANVGNAAIIDLFTSGLRFDFGSDATGDILYRNSTGNISRLPIGSTGQILNVASGLPSWVTSPFAPLASPALTGSPTSATKPTTATGLLRLTDLGTGWAQYRDNVYTSGSPLVVNSGATATITNNAATTIATQLPFGVTSLYNSGTSKITPQLDGDSYLINVRFTAVSNNNAGLADVSIDIGGAMNIIVQETVSLRKGSGQSQIVNLHFDVFSGSTFIANGGLIKLTSIVGDTSIYDISYKITRTHKAK